MLQEELEIIRAQAAQALSLVQGPEELEALRIRFLGKKGALTAALRQMGALSPEERPKIGQLANDVRAYLEESVASRTAELRDMLRAAKLKSETVDVTLPGRAQKVGHQHPLDMVQEEIEDILLGLGFTVATGPEVEWDYYNFEALNEPKNHPARDTQDTFYVNENIVLRTQTSPVQVRTMEKQKPPIRVIAPGRCYRSDALDATHSPVFHQIEGLAVDKGVTMGNLKWLLETLMKRLYGEDTVVRFRPHHFPFTEPSAEMDVQCFQCSGEGCALCKGEGYIELLGCGMVHPKVLAGCGIDPEVYSGFAIGPGLDRLTMMRFKIDDIRLFFENNMRFLRQF